MVARSRAVICIVSIMSLDVMAWGQRQTHPLGSRVELLRGVVWCTCLWCDECW